MSKTEEYRNIAKEFDCLFRIGKYGVNFNNRLSWIWMCLHGRNDTPKPSIIIPLDGWITDPKLIEHEMRKRGFEL